MEANQFSFITFKSIVFLSIQLDKKIDFFPSFTQTTLSQVSSIVKRANGVRSAQASSRLEVSCCGQFKKYIRVEEVAAVG